MPLRWEYIGSLTSLSPEQWKERSNKYRDRYIVLTHDKKLYACLGENDFEGDIKSIEEIARLIQAERSASQAPSSPLKEREITVKTKTKEEVSVFQEIKTPPEKKKEEDPLSIFSSTFDPILFSKSQRENYLNSIEKKPWAEDFFDFQKSLDKLLLEEDIESEVEKFLAAYGKKYNIFESDFAPLSINRSDFFVREKLLNLAFNQHKSKQEVDDFIEAKKESIIAEFAPDKYKNTSKENFTIRTEPKAQETHHKGKVPARIIFSCHGEEVFSVMYKPRTAAIDSAVQELLAQCQIPSYKIISYPEENKSIWTYIDGQDMLLSEEKLHEIRHGSNDRRLKTDGARRSPEAFIHYSDSIQEIQKKELLEQLQHLNKILLCINITDLHGENVRLGKDNKIYPIDLEVLDERQGTLLMIDDYFVDVNKSRLKAQSLLSEREQILIENWNTEKRDPSRKFSLPFRHVLVNSGDLFELRFISNFEQAAKMMFGRINDALKRRGYSQTQEIIIKNQVYIDLLNGDVPFFTESKGIIYYGYLNEGALIGKKK